MDPDDVAELRGTDETTTDELDGTITAVEQDGRWYFSLFYTVAEAARADAGRADDPRARASAPTAATRPRRRSTCMLDRIQALDLAGMIRALNPGEAAALQRYAPLFLDDAQAAARRRRRSRSTITDRKFHVDGDGDQRTRRRRRSHGRRHRRRRVDRRAALDSRFGSTARARTPRSTTRRSTSAPATRRRSRSVDDVPRRLAGRRGLRRCARRGTRPTSSRSASRCVKYDGSWYVSPTATEHRRAMLAVLRALDRTGARSS